MSPYQHGEVFVTDDGAETDLDLVTSERLRAFQPARVITSPDRFTSRLSPASGVAIIWRRGALFRM